MTSPIRLNPILLGAAEREAAIQKRSVPKQIEYWAELALDYVLAPKSSSTLTTENSASSFEVVKLMPGKPYL